MIGKPSFYGGLKSNGELRPLLLPLRLGFMVILAAVAAAPAARAPAYAVVLYVANQSFHVNPVDVKVTVDGETAVEGVFYAKPGTEWRRYELRLAPGWHTLRATSRKGAAAYKGVFNLTGNRWAGLAYRYAPPTSDRDVVTRRFWFALRDHPWGK